MKSKVITLELVNTPDALIRLQELAVKNLKKQNVDEDFLDFQEDITFLPNNSRCHGRRVFS